MAGLLAIDVGNTQTVLGLFEGEELREHWRVATESERTGDELGLLLRGLVDLNALEGVAMSCTVPPLARAYEELAARAGVELLQLGPGVRSGIAVRYEDPREVGPDRIANAVAALERYGAPCIVVDFGTSTNFDVVSPEGEYVGGVLAPGVEVSMEALSARAARLFSIDFTQPPTRTGRRSTWFWAWGSACQCPLPTRRRLSARDWSASAWVISTRRTPRTTRPSTSCRGRSTERPGCAPWAGSTFR
ncbi:MAG: type III pantothenate kinase [Actinobacteria bacterium]|nr:MAG: type III pantothenate kinase [Actinomycetota bacterium]